MMFYEKQLFCFQLHRSYDNYAVTTHVVMRLLQVSGYSCFAFVCINLECGFCGSCIQQRMSTCQASTNEVIDWFIFDNERMRLNSAHNHMLKHALVSV